MKRTLSKSQLINFRCWCYFYLYILKAITIIQNLLAYYIASISLET